MVRGRQNWLYGPEETANAYPLCLPELSWVLDESLPGRSVHFLPRIAIGIPSFREADSIAHVAAIADDGLTRLFPAEDCVIVNADGHSPDGTAAAFQPTSTQCPKVSLDITSAQPGKGANVVAFWEYCAENGIEAAAMLDADVTSITPGWIASLLQPAVAGQAAMAFPLYRRHRFEGATTNLFAYPVISALCGSSIRQPIGGDFGLGRDLLISP